MFPGIIDEMKERRLLEFPDPFTPAEHAAFTGRIMKRIPVRRTLWRPVLALAASLALVFGLLFASGLFHPEVGTLNPTVNVPNPLHMALSQPDWQVLAGDVAFPSISEKAQKLEVPFLISKSDRHIRIVWEEIQGYQYIVQKCLLSAKGRTCRTSTVVNGGNFQDKAADESPLVMYTVEAIKS